MPNVCQMLKRMFLGVICKMYLSYSSVIFPIALSSLPLLKSSGCLLPLWSKYVLLYNYIFKCNHYNVNYFFEGYIMSTTTITFYQNKND